MTVKPFHAGRMKYSATHSRLKHSATCPLCSTYTKMVQDHCHQTGLNRDPLCRKCNMALGLFADNPTILRAAALYLERHAHLHQQYRDRI